ncbi:hypothetical protein HK105_200407 [Polyrhizophydium stewartii]|uniref:Adhesin domain-containing protein n=1 Tax=Polyrhizophydium stewartii TaxID=2732419 RepID=A0ABR4NLD0_9FUNG
MSLKEGTVQLPATHSIAVEVDAKHSTAVNIVRQPAGASSDVLVSFIVADSVEEELKVEHSSTDGHASFKASLPSKSWLQRIFNGGFRFTADTPPDVTVTVALPAKHDQPLGVSAKLSAPGVIAVDDLGPARLGGVTLSAPLGGIRTKGTIEAGSFTASVSVGELDVDTVRTAGDISLTSSTGEIKAHLLMGGSIALNASIGEIVVRAARFLDSFTASAGTGAIDANSVICDDPPKSALADGVPPPRGLVELKSGVGEVRGRFEGFWRLTSTASVGECRLQLAPRQGGRASVKTSIGEASISLLPGFNGRIAASGSGRIKADNQPVNGEFVGDASVPNPSLLEISSSFPGSYSVDFM